MKKIWEVPALEALDVSLTFGGKNQKPEEDGEAWVDINGNWHQPTGPVS